MKTSNEYFGSSEWPILRVRLKKDFDIYTKGTCGYMDTDLAYSSHDGETYTKEKVYTIWFDDPVGPDGKSFATFVTREQFVELLEEVSDES